ncbi:MAG TPA: hypothetical protein DCP08_06420 [Chloroflexi bacterium]|nr:hypothetical protein [Chloroflexota bacterium]
MVGRVYLQAQRALRGLEAGFARLFVRQEGQALIEYVTLVAFGLMVMGAIYFLFTVVQQKFQASGQRIQGIPEGFMGAVLWRA